MKKLSAALILTTVFLSLSGCSAQDRLNQLLDAGDPQSPQKEAEHPRVYMDELCGTIKDFIGNQLTLLQIPPFIPLMFPRRIWNVKTALLPEIRSM